MAIQELKWQNWLVKGDQYLKSGSPIGKSRFNTGTRYNLLSMSLENYIMAMCDFHDNLPDNHTYTELFLGLERVMSIDENLKNRILKYESIQSICAIDKYEIKAPTEEDLVDLKEGVIEIGKLAHETCIE